MGYRPDDPPDPDEWLAASDGERIFRFRAAGLDRHTTIHALASVVAAQLFDILAEKREHRAEDDDAFAELDPEEWRAPAPTHLPRSLRGGRPKKRGR